MVCSVAQAQINLLNNGSFETGDTSGWDDSSPVGAFSVGAPSPAGAQDGSNALLMSALDNTVPSVFQGAFDGSFQIPAVEGDEFNFSAYMLTEDAFTSTGFTAGIIKIVFEDSAGNDLVPASVSIGALNTANPGAEGLPFLTVDSTPDTWIFSETQAVAPANTASVQFLLLNVNFGGNGGAGVDMYFDNAFAYQVPEPSTYALLFGFGALGFVLYRRRKQAKA